ncbi:MAG: UDP-3-O-(3-hydroxymyristoyl)glucosamine N-acyltransferase [Motiliproteus sp.]
MYSLDQIAEHLGAKLIGDPQIQINGVQALDKAGQGQLSFLSNPRYRKNLSTTLASAVMVKADQADNCTTAALVVDDPYLAYALISGWFDTRPGHKAGVSDKAMIDPTAVIAADVMIAAGVVIEAGTVIELGVEIGANSVIGANCVIGKDTRLAANVTLYHEVRLGQRNLVHSGAVIGADGFGFANQQGQWLKISQIGRVITGDDVEIGACTSVDRGAIEDTVIGDGVKIDNQIQIGHNVVIGDHTAMAGCAGVAGSTKIGTRCTIGGAAVIAGHITIADDVHVSGMAMVTKSLSEPGIYSSGTGIAPYHKWRKSVARFNQLDKLVERVSQLEQALKDKD